MKDYHQTLMNNIRGEFKKKFAYANDLAIPKIIKVTINVGVGQGQTNSKIYDIVEKTLSNISGQQPVFRFARKAIAGFKLRQGAKIGLMVTLRGQRMKDFIIRFVNLVLPRLRDFRGLSDKSFDGQGNYCLGISEQTVFPEIKYEEVELIHGLEINFTTSARNKTEAKELLTLWGFPFKKN